MEVEFVHTTTRDGVRLDGMLQMPTYFAKQRPVDCLCFVHGTGGNFYASTLFDALSLRCLERGFAVLRVNTRGHDGISNASTARGGRRLGAAYEVVDDCRHDVTAWLDFLRERFSPHLGLVGHSLGAVKCLYALAHESVLDVKFVVAISPPCLSYEWFCSNPEGTPFLEAYHQADGLVQAGKPAALMEVSIPLPMVITAGGYIEKYGPDERYNYLRFIPSVRCPILLTLGAVEAEHNVAFRGAAEALAQVRHRALSVTTIPDADHFYSQARDALLAKIDDWLLLQSGVE